ncbi:hypothetical protein EJ110_NYTH35116, partial [Nymphaea thermarum]
TFGAAGPTEDTGAADRGGQLGSEITSLRCGAELPGSNTAGSRLSATQFPPSSSLSRSLEGLSPRSSPPAALFGFVPGSLPRAAGCTGFRLPVAVGHRLFLSSRRKGALDRATLRPGGIGRRFDNVERPEASLRGAIFLYFTTDYSAYESLPLWLRWESVIPLASSSVDGTFR